MDFLKNFLYSQLIVRLPENDQSFAGQIAIVTGSNVGLGLEAARTITRLGAAKVIIAVRSVEKGEAAKKSIEESTQRKNVVEVWPFDLSSYESVEQFAARALKLPRLDVLLENAAIATEVYRVAEGHEQSITVNVISTFLLALLLLPKLRETASKFNSTPRPPHLNIVSSEVHFWPKFTEADEAPPGKLLALLDDKAKADMPGRYPLSKLLEVFFVRELAARNPVNKGGVVFNLINPGFCHSELARELGWGIWFMKLVLARSTAVGSRTLVHAAGAEENSHGQYMSDCQVTDPAPLVLNDAKHSDKLHKRVWEELTTELERIHPGVTKGV